MELRDYVRAMAGRWVWVVAGAAVGLLLAATAGLLTPAAYQARVALYVDAAVVEDPEDPSSAAEVRTSPAAPPAPASPPRGVPKTQPVLDIAGQRYALNHPNMRRA